MVVIAIVVILIIRGRQWLIRCRIRNMTEKRHSDQDGMSVRIAGTKETKDSIVFPIMDQSDTACSVVSPLAKPLQLGVIKMNDLKKKKQNSPSLTIEGEHFFFFFSSFFLLCCCM